MLRTLLGIGRFGAGMGYRAGAAVAPAALGGAYGAAAGVAGLAAGVGYLGYRAIRGRGPLFQPGAKRIDLNYGIQRRLIGGTLGVGAAAGLMTRDPGHRADFSPGGNLEVRQPMEATGDLALSLNRNARGVPSPTRFGYAATTTIPATGRF